MIVSYLGAEDTCSSNSKIIDDVIVSSFDQIGFLPLSFLVLCGWFLLNKFYNYIVKVLLSRLCIKDSEVRRLLVVYWNISFTTITIPFALEGLSVPLDQLVPVFYTNIESNVAQWFAQEPVSVKTKMIYILLTGFFLNKVCQISIEKGLNNFDFVSSEFFAVFFVSSYAYRCIKFSIGFMILYNIAQSLLELTRMLHCFSKIYPSMFTHVVTRIVFIVHTITWIGIFLDIVPNYFLLLTMKSFIESDDASHVLILMLLNVALWAFYVCHVVSSPLSKLTQEFLLQRSSSLEWLLFGSPVPAHSDRHSMTHHVISHVSERLTEPPRSVSTQASRQLHRHKSKENLNKVYQTVRCYIRIKRKLNRIRSKLKDKQQLVTSSPDSNSSNGPTEGGFVNQGLPQDNNVAKNSFLEQCNDICAKSTPSYINNLDNLDSHLLDKYWFDSKIDNKNPLIGLHSNDPNSENLLLADPELNDLVLNIRESNNIDLNNQASNHLDLNDQKSHSPDLDNQESNNLDLDNQEPNNLDLDNQEPNNLDLNNQEPNNLDLNNQDSNDFDYKQPNDLDLVNKVSNDLDLANEESD